MNGTSSMDGMRRNFITRHWVTAAALISCLSIALVAASLNIRTSHNWGDDFAQYIIQGRNIVQHRPQLDTGVAQNSWSALRQIPDAAPVGWPLLLSFVYRLYGNDMFRFGQLVGLCTAAFVCVTSCYFRRYWSWSIVIAATAVVGLNPWLIGFKSSILTDIPFAVCTMGVIWLYVRSDRTNWRSSISMGLLSGFALAIRPAAVALIAALALHSIGVLWRNRERWRNTLYHRSVTLGVAVALSVLLNSVLFPTGIGSSYYGFWAKRVVQTTSTTSFAVNTESAPKVSLLTRYGTTIVGEFQVFTQLVPVTGRTGIDSTFRQVFLLAVLIGFIVRLARPRITETFVVIYFGMLIVLQIRPEQGFRYLLPLLPFTIEYVLVSLRLLSHVLTRIRFPVRQPRSHSTA